MDQENLTLTCYWAHWELLLFLYLLAAALWGHLWFRPPIPPMLIAGPTGAGKTPGLEGKLLAKRGGQPRTFDMV